MSPCAGGHKKTWSNRFCVKMVNKLERKINQYGCKIASNEVKVACVAAAGGPEDPLAYVCIGLFNHFCPIILKKLEKHIRSPEDLCAGTASCVPSAAAPLTCIAKRVLARHQHQG